VPPTGSRRRRIESVVRQDSALMVGIHRCYRARCGMSERWVCGLRPYIYSAFAPDHSVDTDMYGIFSRARSRRSARHRGALAGL
jgi:hypothetical protein